MSRKLLLARGANPRVWDWWGRTALYIAIDRKEILDGTDEAKGTAQGAAPAVSSMEIINALLAADVEINASSIWNARAAVGTADVSSILC